tara:strand:+ start:717 stop:1055 length:339 start_codon:yes stop_codon:yes gene_type:complete
MITRITAIKSLVGGNVSGTPVETFYHDGQTPPSEEEIQAKLTELQNAEPMKVLRETRNRILGSTDWRASSDLTLSSEWSTYRQALRDLPSTANPTLDDDGNLQNVTWPKQPT